MFRDQSLSLSIATTGFLCSLNDSFRGFLCRSANLNRIRCHGLRLCWSRLFSWRWGWTCICHSCLSSNVRSIGWCYWIDRHFHFSSYLACVHYIGIFLNNMNWI